MLDDFYDYSKKDDVLVCSGYRSVTEQKTIYDIGNHYHLDGLIHVATNAGSGWGVLISGSAIAILSTMGLSLDVWRGVIVCGLLLSGAMIWHRRLRHFVLLPSCIAFVGALVLITMNVKLMG